MSIEDNDELLKAIYRPDEVEDARRIMYLAGKLLARDCEFRGVPVVGFEKATPREQARFIVLANLAFNILRALQNERD